MRITFNQRYLTIILAVIAAAIVTICNASGEDMAQHQQVPARARQMTAVQQQIQEANEDEAAEIAADQALDRREAEQE